ncbi:hypothetical protein [Novipirellula artificiosorum]|nr:hypothetical protein [Novipirellula artificiosorum]
MTERASFENEATAAAYEQDALEKGWILPKQKGGRPKSWSPFQELAQRIREAAATLDDKKKQMPQIPGVTTASESGIPDVEPAGPANPTPVGRKKAAKKKPPTPAEIKKKLKEASNDKKKKQG